MHDGIVPCSPHEVMCGWMHLPRYIDKIRLQLAGRLSDDYQNNLGKGFDGMWLKAAGLSHEEFVEIVRANITDDEVADWVSSHVIADSDAKRAHAEAMLALPRADDPAMCARLEHSKQQNGFGHRDDIRSFVDLIEADEGRA